MSAPELLERTADAAADTPSDLSYNGYSRTHRIVVASDGIELAVTDYVPAQPVIHTVVLEHGVCLTQASWKNQIRGICRAGLGIRIISCDHRGHGASSEGPLSSYTVDRLATDLAEIVEHLQVRGPLTVAGHSMGGMSATTYAARERKDQPVVPTALVLVATAAGGLAQHGLGRLLATPGLDLLAGLVEHAPHRAAHHAVRMLTGPVCTALTLHGFGVGERNTLAATAAEALHSTPLTTAVGFLRALREYNQTANLSRISARTIIIGGGRDALTPAAHSRQLAAGIAASRYIHLPTAGHMLLQEAASTVSRAILRTVSGNAPQMGIGPRCGSQFVSTPA